MVGDIIDRTDRVHRPGLHPRPAGDRLASTRTGRSRRRPVGQERAVLRRVPGHRQRLLEQRACCCRAARSSTATSTKIHDVDLKDPDADPGVRHALLVQVRRREQGPASVRRRHRAELRARHGHQGHADQHREPRRERQVLVGQVAALEGQRDGSRPARALRRRLRAAATPGVQGAGRRRAEEARRAGHGAVLDARPHRGARPRVPVGGAQDEALLRQADGQPQGRRPRHRQRREVGAVDLARGGQGRRASREAPRGALGHWIKIKDTQDRQLPVRGADHLERAARATPRARSAPTRPR